MMTKFGIGWIAVLFSFLAQSGSAGWVTVPVPGPYGFEGFGWYRTWFKPPQRFFAKHERDLWGESVIFNVQGLAGAHEVYVNGNLIGSGGSFPPDFQDGQKGNHQHKVPSGSLVPEVWNQLAVRVYAPRRRRRLSGRGSLPHELLPGVRLRRTMGVPSGGRPRLLRRRARPASSRLGLRLVPRVQPGAGGGGTVRPRPEASASGFVSKDEDGGRSRGGPDAGGTAGGPADPLQLRFPRAPLGLPVPAIPVSRGTEDDQPGPLLPLALRQDAPGAPAPRPRARRDLHPRRHHRRRQI